MLAKLREHREKLTGMMLELQANQVACKRLRDCHGGRLLDGVHGVLQRLQVIPTTTPLSVLELSGSSESAR